MPIKPAVKTKVVETAINSVVPRSANDRRPYLIRHSALLVYIVILIIAQIIASTYLGAAPTIHGEPKLTQVEDEILVLVNEKRLKANRAALSTNVLLQQAAHAKAQDMFARGYYSHTSPEGKNGWDFISDQGYAFGHAGENLAQGFSSAEAVMMAWQESPAHLSNIVSNQFTETGIAVVTDKLNGNEVTLFVELFASSEKIFKGGAAIPQRFVSAVPSFIANFSFLNPFANQKQPFTALSFLLVMFVGYDAYMLSSIGKLHHWHHRLRFTVAILLLVTLIALAFFNVAQIL